MEDTHGKETGKARAKKKTAAACFYVQYSVDRGGVRAFPAPCGFMYFALDNLFHFSLLLSVLYSLKKRAKASELY